MSFKLKDSLQIGATSVFNNSGILQDAALPTKFSGTTTKPTFDAQGRATAGASLVAADIPALDAAKIASGIIPVTQGGTGVATLAGIPYGNGTSAFGIASAAQIVAAIGTTSVTNATTAINVSGTIAIANGGTGQTSASAALTALGGCAVGSTAGAALAASGAIGVSTTASRSDHVHAYPTAANVGAVATTAVGAANGVAGLDSGGKVPVAQLPASVIGGMQYQNTWNAATNTPTIPAAAAGNKGYYYKVAVAGSANVDGITDWKVGDWIVSNGSAWDKIDNTEAVSSVNGATGAVSLNLNAILAVSTYTTSELHITNNTASTNTATGALTVTGGLGVDGKINAGSISTGQLDATTVNTGALNTTGSVSCTGLHQVVTLAPTGTGRVELTAAQVTIAPTSTGTMDKVAIGSTTPNTAVFTTVRATDTTGSTTLTTGASVVSGGAAIAKTLSLGGDTVKYATLSQTKAVIDSAVTASLSAVLTSQIVDAYPLTLARSCKYVVQIIQGPKIQVSEVLVTHDGNVCYFTEYGVIESNGSLATITCDVFNSTNVRLLASLLVATAATVTVTKTLLV